MSRAVTRRNQRIAAVRNQTQWERDCASYWTREAARERLADRIRTLAEKIRTGPERPADVAELDRLWGLIAR